VPKDSKKSMDRLTAWEYVGRAFNDDCDEFRPGDVCRRKGKGGWWRIIGIDQHRSGMTELKLRGEKSSREMRVDIDDVEWIEPPYPVVY
jgi:hypothetical protein